MAREILRAADASNDGVRRLRELLRSFSAAQLATKVGCDATAIRRWAREVRTPTPEWRERMRASIGVPVEAWELRAGDDLAVTQPTLPRG